MEYSWILPTPISLNANTPTLRIKKPKTLRELFLVIYVMTDVLEPFGKKLGEQKQDSFNRINKM